MIYDSDIFVIALRLSGWNSTQSKHGISRMSRWDYMQTKGGEAKEGIMGLPPPSQWSIGKIWKRENRKKLKWRGKGRWNYFNTTPPTPLTPPPPIWWSCSDAFYLHLTLVTPPPSMAGWTHATPERGKASIITWATIYIVFHASFLS